MLIPFAENKQEALQAMLYELQNNQLEIVLVDAPKPKFIGHRIRIVQSKNAEWYIYYFQNYSNVRRDRTLARLERMIETEKHDSESYHDESLNLISEMLVCDPESEEYAHLPNAPF